MLARVGRRLGQAPMNCPGDPGCPGNLTPVDVFNLPLVGPYTAPNPLTALQLSVAAESLNPNAPASVSSFSSVLSSIGTGTILAVGGGVLLLLALTGGRRRR